MPAADIETDFPRCLAAYLNAWRSAIGLPVAATLPIRTLTDDTEASYPQVFIAATQIQLPHKRRTTLTVIVELQTQMEATTPSTEDGWMARLTQLLNDTAAFRQFLAAWSGDDAPAFELRQMRITAFDTRIDVEKKIRGRSRELSVHVRPFQLAPLPAI